jgi:hypothetical protein
MKQSNFHMAPLRDQLRWLALGLTCCIAFFACDTRETECPDRQVRIQDECVCENPYSGDGCLEVDSCLLNNITCNGFECEGGACQCIGFWNEEGCTHYLPNDLADDFEVLKVDFDSIPNHQDFRLQSFRIPTLIYDTDTSFQVEAEVVGSFQTVTVQGTRIESSDEPLVFDLFSPTERGFATLYSFQCTLRGDSILGSGRLFEIGIAQGDDSIRYERSATLQAVRR